MVDGVRGQANYHRNTNSQLGGMADRLHRITATLFCVTFALALTHVSIETIGPESGALGNRSGSIGHYKANHSHAIYEYGPTGISLVPAVRSDKRRYPFEY